MSKMVVVLKDLRKRKLRRDDADFQVKELTNTIMYQIGDTLNEQQVQDLCNMSNQYTVKIQHPDKK